MATTNMDRRHSSENMYVLNSFPCGPGPQHLLSVEFD